MMSDPDERPEQPEQSALPTGGVSLGNLGRDGFDTSLGGQPDPASAEQARTAPGAADEGRPGLPHGALVVFRKSGGLRFSSRGIVVTRKGWVEPLEGTAGRRRRITPEALRALDLLLLQSGLTRAPGQVPTATRDGFSYEIAARVGGKLRQVELGDPVPAEQERLVRALTRLLPG